MLKGVRIPSAKSLDDEGLEGDALGTTVVEVGANLGRFPHLDGGSRRLGGAIDDSVLE